MSENPISRRKFVTNRTAVDPGSQSAILTMGDGTVLHLDEMQEGILTQTYQIRIKKTATGQLSYEIYGDTRMQRIDTNTLVIPKGGAYKITLPDGTKVWLNAASKLRFPVLFGGKTRTVELEGEAYFEVAKNTQQPFIVHAGNTQNKVTGTTFNVTAYAEGTQVVTTLVEGQVYVYKGDKSVKLAPGQQSLGTKNAGLIKREADVEAVLGWKNGYFMFDDQDVETVLRNISRWYDVDIYIRKEVSSKLKIGGAFSKKRDIEELLQYLEKLNVLKFKKDGRRVSVMI